MAYTYDRRTAKSPTPDNLRELLLRIDHGDYHTLPLKGVPAVDKPLLSILENQGHIKLIRSGHLPPHYVLTNRGIHSLGTFRGILAT